MKELADYSDDDLITELTRRQQDAQRRADRLSFAATGKVKSPGKSAAKRAYWDAYRASGLTLKQFQQKRKKDAKG